MGAGALRGEPAVRPQPAPFRRGHVGARYRARRRVPRAACRPTRGPPLAHRPRDRRRGDRRRPRLPRYVVERSRPPRAVPAPARDPAPPAAGRARPHDRPAPVPQPEHGAQPPVRHLPPSRRPFPGRAARPAAAEPPTLRARGRVGRSKAPDDPPDAPPSTRRMNRGAPPPAFFGPLSIIFVLLHPNTKGPHGPP